MVGDAGGANLASQGSCTISETATTGTIAGPITVSPGKTYGVKVTPTGTPAATGDWEVLFTVTGDGQLLSTPSAATHPESAGVTYFGAPDQRGNQNSRVLAQFYAPCDGTLSYLYADGDVMPGGSASFTVTVEKDGSSTALTTTVTGSVFQNHDASNSVSVTKGQLLNYRLDVGAGAATTHVRYSVLFVPTTPGDTIYIFEGAIVQSTGTYICGEVAGSTDESKLFTMPACTASNLYNTSASTPQTSGQTNALTVRKGSPTMGDTSLACTITGTATSASDTNAGHAVSFADGDKMTVHMVVGAGTAVVGSKASMCLNFAQGGVWPWFMDNVLAGGMNVMSGQI